MPLLIIVIYQIAGLPILVKYVPIFMSHAHGILEAYPLFIYSAGWLLIIGAITLQGRRHEIADLGLSHLPRTSGKGVHFPREKAWLFQEMPISLAHPGRKGRSHIECLADMTGSIVIFWLPRNLGAGLFINNLEEEPKVVMVRAGVLSFEVTAKWQHEILSTQDPAFRDLRCFSREPIDAVLHSNDLLKKITTFIDYLSLSHGRLVIEDSLVAAYFPDDLPHGDELFPRAYDVWHAVATTAWPHRRFNPFGTWRSCVSLLLVAAVIAAFVVAIVFTLKG